MAALCLLGTAAAVAQGDKRQIRFADIPASLQPWVEAQGISARGFSDHIAGIGRQTAARERDGEFDHLIFFLLQSRSFTTQPKIEPALSAHEFVRGLGEADREKYLSGGLFRLPAGDRIPKLVRVRIGEFIKAIAKNRDDARLAYFKQLLNAEKTRPADLLIAEYARAMRFLYRKEFASREIKPEQLTAYISSLYQTRGHSTDTQIEANYAVYTAMAALKAQSPSTQIRRVLIIGPGLDFAPRTDLIDAFGPQSYQPFAVADALLGLKFAQRESLRIHCADINDRVVDYFQGLRRYRAIKLSVLSGVRDTASHPLTGDFKDYFCNLGESIGVESAIEVPAPFSSHLKKSLLIRDEITGLISVDRLNIITERYVPSPQYDLVVVTNVFPYFNQTELLFALTNIAAMLKPGGYLIHNELQTMPTQFVNSLGLPLQQARTLLIASSETAPLFDGVAIHRKN